MRLAALALILLATPAAAGPADYAAAYGRARAYGLAHLEQRQPSCRAAIGARSASLLLAACDQVAGASTRNACTRASSCAQILDRLDWCSEWRDGVPCAPGGEDRAGRDMGDWWTRTP